MLSATLSNIPSTRDFSTILSQPNSLIQLFSTNFSHHNCLNTIFSTKFLNQIFSTFSQQNFLNISQYFSKFSQQNLLRKCWENAPSCRKEHILNISQQNFLNIFSTFSQHFFSTKFPQQTILNKFSTIYQQILLFFLVIQVALQSGECWQRKRRSLMMSMDGEGGRKNWIKGRNTIEGGRKTEMGAERVRDVKREIWLDRSIF